ncbi:MAG: type II toxin-antitoxin system VapB family antitoxin [Methylocystis sp.]|nr:type II toxin-antitoxin system VapB family antitoxin [Methylocystis sp.]
MPFHIRDKATDTIVRKLAAVKGTSMTEAVRQAAEHELRRLRQEQRPLAERIAAIQKRANAFPPSGLAADKAFYDELSGEP